MDAAPVLQPESYQGMVAVGSRAVWPADGGRDLKFGVDGSP